MSTDRAGDVERPVITAAESARYHALDRVRASAMLLGVVYHTLLFRLFTAGPPMGPSSGASKWPGDWLHSFRMPLFFLISGFFGRMMLEKYGTREFLRRRWTRIGLPLVIGMFTFGPLYLWTRDLTSRGPGSGPPPMGAPGRLFSPLPPGEGPGVRGAASPVAWKGARKDATRPTTPLTPALSRREREAEKTAGVMNEKVSVGQPSGRGAGGEGRRLTSDLRTGSNDGHPTVDAPHPAPLPEGEGARRGDPRDRSMSAVPGFRPGGPPPFGMTGGGLASRLFGPYTRYVQLNHLWFLWYLLLFVTAAPFLAKGLSLVARRPPDEETDGLGLRVVRLGLAPALLAAVSLPALLMTSSPFGWFLGLAPAIFRAFPDFLLHLDPDMAFYFLYFLAGWWLHRDRAALPILARAWLPNLLLGLGAFAVAMNLEGDYGNRSATPDHGSMRVLAYACYCVGSASTSFGFLGVFLRYLDSPSRTWRYLADTALWVYLIHQPLVLIGLAACRPLNLPWWALTAVVSTSSVAVALLLYEAIVRPTPLVRLFGPSNARRRDGTGVS